MDTTLIAVDLAKDVFELACANRAGRIIDRHRFNRLDIWGQSNNFYEFLL